MSNTPVTNLQPNASPDAAAQGAPVMPAQPAPDLSAMTTPGPAAQPNLQTAALGSVQEDVTNIAKANQAYTDLANKPLDVAPVPGIATGPHARLINMISGLALGADAFGKSLATRGKEGGVQEVDQYQAQQQEMQQSAQRAAQAQRNSELQQKLTTAAANTELMKNHLMLATLPTDLQMKDLALEEGQQRIQSGQQSLATNEADFRASHFGMSPTDFNSMMSGTGTGNAQNIGVMRSQIQQNLSAAIQNPQVGANDPYVQQVQKTLADPNATPQQIFQASQSLDRQVALKKGVTAATTEQANASTATTNAQYAAPKAQADIAKARAQAASAASSYAKSVFDLGQEKREATDLATPDVTGFSSQLTPKEYDKRYDSFRKSKDYQTLDTLKGSYQQFNDTLNHIAQTGDMTGAESVVGLFNAIGISATPLAGKGFRINSNTIDEHAEARGIDQAAYQKLLKLKNGDVITPKQLQDYSNIAAGVYHNSYVNAADEAHSEGLPIDFLPQGGGRPLDPVTASIYSDVVLHSNPNLARDPKALKAAIAQAIQLNGWTVR